MDREILIQYSSLKEECQDLQKEIRKLDRQIKKLEEGDYLVSDTVKGTRSDGTYGLIKITGIPMPFYYKQKALLEKRREKLDTYELQLLQATNDVDDYINSLTDSRMRRILRYKFLDELSWVAVAHRMGGNHTADSCRKQVDRFFENQ